MGFEEGEESLLRKWSIGMELRSSEGESWLRGSLGLGSVDRHGE